MAKGLVQKLMGSLFGGSSGKSKASKAKDKKYTNDSQSWEWDYSVKNPKKRKSASVGYKGKTTFKAKPKTRAKKK
jgi:hypothetical protein